MLGFQGVSKLSGGTSEGCLRVQGSVMPEHGSLVLPVGWNIIEKSVSSWLKWGGGASSKVSSNSNSKSEFY